MLYIFRKSKYFILIETEYRKKNMCIELFYVVINVNQHSEHNPDFVDKHGLPCSRKPLISEGQRL